MLEGSGRLNLSYLIRLEGSGRLNLSCFTCLDAQNVDKFFTFARFWDGRLWEEGSGRLGRQNQSYFTCLEGSGRLKVSYFTCLEAQNVDMSWCLDTSLPEQ